MATAVVANAISGGRWRRRLLLLLHLSQFEMELTVATKMCMGCCFLAHDGAATCGRSKAVGDRETPKAKEEE